MAKNWMKKPEKLIIFVIKKITNKPLSNHLAASLPENLKKDENKKYSCESHDHCQLSGLPFHIKMAKNAFSKSFPFN